MPAAVVAVAGMAAGAAVSAAVTGAVVAGITIGTVGAAVIGGVASMAVSSLASNALGLNKSPQQQQTSAANAAVGVIVNTAGTSDPIPVIYGLRRIGGTRCLTEVSGDSNQYLHVVIAHCEGEIAGIDAIYLDNVPSGDARFANLVTSETYVGTDAQAASTALATALPGRWTTNHKLSGVAYTYLRLTYDQNAFHGLPLVSVDIRGRKVFDPRDGTTKYSANPALCIRDYLTHTRFGRGIAAADLDDASFIAAANYCDVALTVPAAPVTLLATCNNTATLTVPSISTLAAGYTFTDYRNGATTTYTVQSAAGTTVTLDKTFPWTGQQQITFTPNAGAAQITQPRYTCNAVLNTDTSSLENVRLLLGTCRGILVFSGGKYRLVLDAPAVAGFTFNEDNIVGGWKVMLGEKRRMFNRVRASWIDPTNQWQPAIQVTDSTAFRTADNGLMLEAQLDLSCTTNTYEAQMLAGRHLRQSRFGTVAQFTATIAGTLCEVGDIVAITHSTPGWTAKPFRVMNIALLNSDEVEVTALEYDDSVYAVDPLTAASTAPGTNLPDPFTVGAVSGLTVGVQNITQPDGTIIPRLVASWIVPNDSFVVGYEVAWRENGGPWDTATVTSNMMVIPAAVTGRSYDVRVRSVNSMGIRGSWNVQDGTTCTAPVVPPAAPTATVTGAMFSVRAAWSFGDVRQDVRGTEIWWSATNDRSTAALLTFVPFAAREYNHIGLSAGQGGYYWFRVCDTFGNESAWYPVGATAGLYAAANSDPSALLTQLQGALGEDQLAAELATPIAMIPGHQADLRKLSRNIETAAEAALNAALKLAEVDSTMTDAGIVIDHDTGEVYIYGVREAERRLSSAEVRLNGAEASINLKASVTYVDQAIATAVIDPSQIAALDDIYLRLTTAEVDINGAEASIALKANSTTVDGINGRLVTAEGEIDVLQGQIVLKAETTEVDAIDARLNTAETTLNTIDGASIVQSVASLRQLSRDADAVAEAQLAGLLFADRNITALATVVASAKNELYAHTNDGLAAEAGARLTLAAQVDATAAALTSEQTTRATADSAIASDVTTLQARLDTGDYATVKTTATATANALGEVEAKWGVQVQTMADGVNAVAGLTLLAGTDGETVFAILANKLLIYKPDGTGVPKQIVTLGTVNGLTALGLDGNLIIDGSVVARHLAVETLSAISANLGNITTGNINIGGHAVINSDGSAYFDNITVVRQLSVATGTVPGLAGTYGVTPGEGWKLLNTVTVDTGYVVGAWWSASDRAYQASAGINGGTVTVWAYFSNFGTFIANWAVVVKRIYPKSRWNTATTLMLELELWAEVDGSCYQINVPAPSWALFKVT